LLPEIIEQFAVEEGALMGTDPAGLAVGALVVCAAALPDHTQIQVKRHDPNWLECARLWASLIGNPSTKKSPIILRVAKPLKRLDAVLFRAYLADCEYYDKLSKEDRKRTEPPKQRRLRLEDTTIEAAQEVLKHSPDGLLALHDELSSWFGQMDKYSGPRGAAKDRGFWLQSFNGGPYAVNRIGRGSSLIENLSICLLGSIQPDTLRRVAVDTVDDGLLQRLIPIVLQQGGRGQDIASPHAAGGDYDRLIERLHLSIRPPAPSVFDDDALALRTSLEQKHLDLMTACETVNKKLASHIGKYDGLFARMCLLWHCIEQTSGPITTHTAQRVADFMRRFLLPHACAFYMGILGLSDDHDRLTAVASFILAHHLDNISNREVAQSVRDMRGLKRHDIDPIFQQLNALGWLLDPRRMRANAPPHWPVNPEVHRLFAERAARETARRAKERAMLAEMFKKDPNA
jgi:hypothetical protein